MALSITKGILEAIFALEGMKHADRKTLIERYDTTAKTTADVESIGTSTKPVPLEGNEITEIPLHGILIDHPGNYTFANDIVWTSPFEAVPAAAITITASNVTLDLNGHFLQASVKQNYLKISGINVKNAHSVTIRNGRLLDMCYYGISANGAHDLSVEDITVEGMLYNNIVERGMCPAGIFSTGGKNTTISNCLVENIVSTSDCAMGIQLQHTYGGLVTGCKVNNILNKDGSIQGFGYSLCRSVATRDCHSSNFTSEFHVNTGTLGHTVLGLCPIFCMELTFEHCSATDMTGCCDDCHGMSVFLDAMVTVDHFTAERVTDGVAASHTGAKATGLEVYGIDVTVTNSQVHHIKAIRPQDLQSTGFSAAGWKISFENCVATHVEVCDQNGEFFPQYGYGIGFGWAPDPRWYFRMWHASHVTYTNCQAEHCQVGFDSWNHEHAAWNHVAADNCQVQLLYQPGEQRTVSCGPCSECNEPITTDLMNHLGPDNQYPPNLERGNKLS